MPHLKDDPGITVVICGNQDNPNSPVAAVYIKRPRLTWIPPRFYVFYLTYTSYKHFRWLFHRWYSPAHSAIFGVSPRTRTFRGVHTYITKESHSFLIITVLCNICIPLAYNIFLVPLDIFERNYLQNSSTEIISKIKMCFMIQNSCFLVNENTSKDTVMKILSMAKFILNYNFTICVFNKLLNKCDITAISLR